MHPQLIPLSKQLHPFLPLGTEIQVAEMIITNNVHLKLTKHRATKLGDYRPPFQGKGHRITVNKSLNPFSFLITFVHEVAHLTCWNKHQNKAAPHGKEWKADFKHLMKPFLAKHVFPENILTALHKYMQNPAASSCADVDLLKALQYHQPDDGLLNLEELPENKDFVLDGNKFFRKGPLERKRFRCLNLTNKRYYFVNALARVKPMEDH
ncbi:MAG: sprT domain-containing protein [Bacteroidia bacterium]